jgi:hypothetical protein
MRPRVLSNRQKQTRIRGLLAGGGEAHLCEAAELHLARLAIDYE